MLVKVCGITRQDDAERAVQCGVDALGFVFWPDSPRFIEPIRARAIVASLPPFVTAVGVFVNQPSEHINAVAAAVGLGAIQLHGDEAPAQLDELVRPVLKALSLERASEEVLNTWPRRAMLLVDAHDPVRRGGTGRTVDWARAAAIASQRPIVLAGGLRPENVADAIALVQPYGVDVSSGVEAEPGIKDSGRLRAFFEAVGRSRPSRSTAWTVR